MSIIKKVLGEKEIKPNPQIWYERAYMFLNPKEAKVFCDQLKIFCSIDFEDQNNIAFHKFTPEQWPLTSTDLWNLAETMEYLAKKHCQTKGCPICCSEIL